MGRKSRKDQHTRSINNKRGNRQKRVGRGDITEGHEAIFNRKGEGEKGIGVLRGKGDGKGGKRVSRRENMKKPGNQTIVGNLKNGSRRERYKRLMKLY